MSNWVLAIGFLYGCGLILALVRARHSTRNDNDFLTGGANIGSIVGGLTVAATLFSTFTLMGMPDLFRKHGVGAWIFLGVADCALAFVALWFGVNIRRRIQSNKFRGMSNWLKTQYGSRHAANVYLLGVFVFMVPYVAIQIKGVSMFLNAALPNAMPIWAWSVAIVSIIVLYSEAGGLKAIVFADSIQGSVLFIATVIVATRCIQHFEGISSMFDAVESTQAALLSLPGPSGLFSTQFLLASIIAIICIPITQPQMTVRLVIMKNTRSLARMAIMLGIFSFVLILATLPIGFYGAVLYPNHSTAEFVIQVLVHDQIPLIGAIIVIGLIGAAISTADSQLFALGTEFRSCVESTKLRTVSVVRGAVVLFAVAALVVSLVSDTHIVLLARTSFSGTSLLAPMILAAVFFPSRLHRVVPIITGIGLIVFLISISSPMPNSLFGVRVELALFIVISVTTIFATKRLSKIVSDG